MRALILRVRRYDFTNEGGEVIRGTSIDYLENLDLPSDPATRGIGPVKLTADFEAFEGFKEVPGVYDIDLGRRAGAKGKVMDFFKGAKFVKPFSVADACK